MRRNKEENIVLQYIHFTIILLHIYRLLFLVSQIDFRMRFFTFENKSGPNNIYVFNSFNTF